MSYRRFRGLSGLSISAGWNGTSAAQASAINAASATDTANPPSSDYGNLPANYAGLVLHWDGTFGPPSDISSFIAKNSGPSQSGSYWQGIVNANRYVVLLNANGEPMGTIGAIAAPAAAAITATYTPVVASTSGQSVATASTAQAEAAAQPAIKAAQAASPVPTVSQPTTAAQPGQPVQTASAVHLPYGTPVTLPDGTQGFADGNGGVIAGAPPTGNVLATSSLPFVTGDVALAPASPADTSAIDTGTDLATATAAGTPIGFSLSPAVLIGGAVLAYFLFRRRRTA